MFLLIKIFCDDNHPLKLFDEKSSDILRLEEGKLDTLKSFEILLKRSNNEWSWSTDSDTLSFDETKLKGKTKRSYN